MGDRGVVCIEEKHDDERFGRICLYSHWSGSKLPIITQGVMKTSQNINDIERLGIDILMELEYGNKEPTEISPLITFLRETGDIEDIISITTDKPLLMSGKMIDKISGIYTKVELLQSCHFEKGILENCKGTVRIIEDNKTMFNGSYQEFIDKDLEK